MGIQTKSYILPMHSYASPLLWVSPFPIHFEVMTSSENVPMSFTSSENQILKQRRKLTGLQCGADIKRIPLYYFCNALWGGINFK